MQALPGQMPAVVVVVEGVVVVVVVIAVVVVVVVVVTQIFGNAITLNSARKHISYTCICIPYC